MSATPTADPVINSALASRAALTAGLRDLADFLDEHPELPDPHVWACTWWHGGGTAEVFRSACEVLFPLGGATVKPDDDRVGVVVKRSFGPVRYELQAKRSEVCETRTTTREVVEHVLPEWAQPPVEDAS